MREILFRGKRIDSGEWVEGCYLHDYKYSNDYITKPGMFCAEVLPETVGQYTGLNDRNGKRIFEGDIVKCTDTINGIEMTAIVEFENPNGENNWGFQLRRIHGDKANPDILLWVETEIDGVYTEVIGNIHDNLELLEATD